MRTLFADNVHAPVRSIFPVHPFPARMAADIAFAELGRGLRPMNVLDPMVGSGTTVAIAARNGHRAYGFDTDPLAVLISKVWCSNVQPRELISLGRAVIEEAKTKHRLIELGSAYPFNCTDEETKKYIRFWFDPINRKQLFALSEAIRNVTIEETRIILWCAFSRLIIKKNGGASLAIDVSHSRPHKVTDFADMKPFDAFEESLKKVLSCLARSGDILRAADIRLGDARNLPIKSRSIDLVITSPPYLNAIDYMRGHRMSLVWMGYPIPELRAIRANNIGSERSECEAGGDWYKRIVVQMSNRKDLGKRLESKIMRYVNDLDGMLVEVTRVLRNSGKAIFVIGNSTVEGVPVRNSYAIGELAHRRGMKIVEVNSRRLPASKRYLPPPSKTSGNISKRLRTETVLCLIKA